MARAVTKGDMVWGYLAQGLNIGAGLLLLPPILMFLPKAEVGLWFVFITLGSLAQLLEFGFQPTIARNAAYIYSGAEQLSKVGVPLNLDNSSPLNTQLLGQLIDTSKKICRLVAFLASLVLLLLGTLYIYSLLTPDQSAAEVVIAWLAFSTGYLLNFYFSYINAFLQGRGDIDQSNKVIVLSRCALILLGSTSVVFGFGLPGLGLSVLLSALLGRLVAVMFFLNHDASRQAASCKREKTGNILSMLWYNASRLGIVQLGAFLIQRGNILLASSFLGLEAASSYSMTVTILIALSSVSNVACQLQVPYASALQLRGARDELIPLYGEMLVLSTTVYLFGLLFLIVVGDSMLALLGSEVKLLPIGFLVLLGIVLFLELHHSVAATYLTTLNKVPFVKAGLYSGIAVFALGFVLIQQFGIIGIIIAQGFVQASYNNWKWPLEAVNHLNVGLFEVLLKGGGRVVRRFVELR